jgi:hypothetical protein
VKKTRNQRKNLAAGGKSHLASKSFLRDRKRVHSQARRKQKNLKKKRKLMLRKSIFQNRRKKLGMIRTRKNRKKTRISLINKAMPRKR